MYAERFLHPTGWRSSYIDLKNWLDKYNDHPDATRITRIALRENQIILKVQKNQHLVFKWLWNLQSKCIKTKISFR